MRVSLLMIPVVYGALLWQTCTPKRCAVVGKTHVTYVRSWSADDRAAVCSHAPGEGVIVDYCYEYTSGPDRYNNFGSVRTEGTYLRNSRFPHGYIVQPHDGTALRFVEQVTFVSGYTWRVPALHSLGPLSQRVGDLPTALLVYPDGLVRLQTDQEGIQRKVRRIFFTNIGTPEYEVLMTDSEDTQSQKEAGVRRNENLTLGYFREEELIAV